MLITLPTASSGNLEFLLQALHRVEDVSRTGWASIQTAIGHWGEMMFPLFSILRRESAFQWPPAQFVLMHLKRVGSWSWLPP